MSINIEDLEDLGICKLGHQKRLLLGIKKAKLSRRRTTNFEQQGHQSISRSQFEGATQRDGLSKLDPSSTPSPRSHLRSSSLSVAVPLSPPPLSERKRTFTARPPPCSPKPTPGRPSCKPPAPPVSSSQQQQQQQQQQHLFAVAFGKEESMKLQTTSKSHFEEFLEKDSFENVENKARPCQRTSGEGLPGIVPVSNHGISGCDAVKPAGLRVSQPVLWSSTLGFKQRKTEALGKVPSVKLDKLETVGSHQRDIKATQAANQASSIYMLAGKSTKADATEKKSSKKFWNPIGKHQQATKLAAPKIKEEPKTNLRALVQNYGDWIKERGMVDLHTPKPQESSSGWNHELEIEPKTASHPAKMQPQGVVSQTNAWPSKINQDTAFGNHCRYESEAWKESIEKDSPSHAIFSCDNSTEESLLTPYGEHPHQHQNGLGLFQRLRDTTRPLSWMTSSGHQQPSSPASPSPPPYPSEEVEEEEVAGEGSHLKVPTRAAARPVARVAALHVTTHQTFLQPSPSLPVAQANKKIVTDYNG